MTDGYLSGTRLRAVLQVAGAAQRFVGWHDSMLGLDCDFQVDSAGVQRCLPLYSGGSVGFADAACKQPVVTYYLAGTMPEKYVADPGYVFTCGAGPHFLSVGAATAATEFHSKDDTGACGPASSIVGQSTYQLGAVVPDVTFVGASKVATEVRDARLSATVRVASDGSRQVTSFYDSSRKTECNPLQVSAGGYACVPDAKAYIEYFFTDTGCMTPAAFHPGYAQQVCGFTPDIVQNTSPKFMSTYYEIGAKITAPVHNANGLTCPVYDPPPSLAATFYSVGAALPLTVFPPFTLSNEGADRVQVQTLRNAAGILISREQFYDTTFGVTCNAIQAADLVQRCLPVTAYGGNLFSDDQCKQALFSTSPGTPPPADVVYLDDLQTNGGEAIFKLGAKTATPAHTYELNGLDCVELGVTAGQDYYATTVVAPGDLAAITRKVE